VTIGREFRLIVRHRPDVRRLREDLIGLAGGFTEIEAGGRLRFILCLAGRDAKQRVLELVEAWKTRGVVVSLEDQERAPDRDEVYFLLPLQRNPDLAGGPRGPLFTNEDLAGIRTELARRFSFRPEMVRVYGEWRNAAGELVPDVSFLIRVPRRGRGTTPSLRRFLREHILANPRCDQDCLYLSNRWRGEYVYPV